MAKNTDEVIEKEEQSIDERMRKLEQRKRKLSAMEAEVIEREKALKEKESRRKQIILRLPETLWADIAAWAEDDFRSINSQIEYLLTKSVKENRKSR